MADTKELNGNKQLLRGMRVVDMFGHHGVIVEIEIPEDPSNTDHGSITVWQSKRFNHGDDNCEHYAYHDWQNILRIERNQS